MCIHFMLWCDLQKYVITKFTCLVNFSSFPFLIPLSYHIKKWNISIFSSTIRHIIRLVNKNYYVESVGDRQQFLRGALHFCFLLRSCTSWRTDNIWEYYHSAQMYNTVCWPKQSVSVPFALYIKKNCWNYPTCGIIL